MQHKPVEGVEFGLTVYIFATYEVVSALGKYSHRRQTKTDAIRPRCHHPLITQLTLSLDLQIKSNKDLTFQ